AHQGPRRLHVLSLTPGASHPLRPGLTDTPAHLRAANATHSTCHRTQGLEKHPENSPSPVGRCEHAISGFVKLILESAAGTLTFTRKTAFARRFLSFQPNEQHMGKGFIKPRCPRPKFQKAYNSTIFSPSQ